ncbi:MAG: SMC family ATPase [Lachnospiraceae bacterium]|nr:SMC family ATPase [Lachnospiraceae bacterium]
MRPVKLVICGWGPYKEKQEIDFQRLDGRGLFLITGPTGAGKTTVFDAVTYALYGNMSGGMREKTSVRSDFVASDVPTYVELTMTHDGRTYIIYRNPEYLRPRKRLEGLTKEKEKAVLTEPDGRTVEGGNEVTRRVQEILRLDYRQFKQLSMIAQGEFAKLLTASPNEKTRIFREIFGTDLYEKMASFLKGQSASAYRQVMECRHKMDEDIDLLTKEQTFTGEQAFTGEQTFTYEQTFTGEQIFTCEQTGSGDGSLTDKTVRERWQELTSSGSYYYDGLIELLEQQMKRGREELKDNRRQFAKAEKQVQKYTEQTAQAERAKSLLDRLKSEKLRGAELQKEAVKVRKREKLLERQEAAAALRIEETRKQTAQEYVSELEKQIQEKAKEIQLLARQQEEGKALYESRDKLQTAYQLEREVKRLFGQEKELRDSSKQEKDKLCKLQRKYLQAEKEEEDAKRIYEQADKQYRHGMAGILGEELVPDMPCPVCGSVHHPVPAKREQNVPDEESVRRLKTLFEEKQQARIELHGKTTAYRAKTEELDRQCSACGREREEAEKALQKERKLLGNYIEKHTEADFRRQLKEYEQIVTLLEERRSVLDRQKEELKVKDQEAADLCAGWERQILTAGFTGEQDYREALTDPEELHMLRESIQDFKREYHTNKEMLMHLQKETKGMKEENLQQIREKLEESREWKKSLLDRQIELNNRTHRMEESHASLVQKREQLAVLMEQYSLLKDLDDAANGNNKRKLVFEQYVLASYFEEILRAANIRLHLMSGGRYELRRIQQVSDGRSKDNLEIEVMDYYTGKYRSVKTLSGGESFKASLALALGMSDVVQAGSGGIRVETLFIDEGFGSLDEESLEQACLTLQTLVEKDRLIGIISHVPELAEKIENQIRIRKTNAGSSIEVMVS